MNKNINKNNKKQFKEKGITLIALVITIIILLILAGVSIATLTGKNGILTRAQETKTKTNEAENIEKIRLAILEAQIGENGYQEINQSNLQSAIDNQFGKDKATVIDMGEGSFIIKLNNREYEVSSSKNITEIDKVTDTTPRPVSRYRNRK